MFERRGRIGAGADTLCRFGGCHDLIQSCRTAKQFKPSVLHKATLRHRYDRAHPVAGRCAHWWVPEPSDVGSRVGPVDRNAALADIDQVIAYRCQLPSDDTNVVAAATRFHACINRYAPRGSVYRGQAERFHKSPRPDVLLLGILVALREDVANDRLAEFEELVHADVFADLLDQADALNHEGYARAGAVVCGAALEEHLKKLAIKLGLSTSRHDGSPKPASMINAELKSKGLYAETQRSIIEGWQKLRNDAAHGNVGFEAPNTSLAFGVPPMISGVRAFITQYPA